MIALLRACHLQPSLAVTAIATALAVSAGRGAGWPAVTAAVLAGQLSVGWSNDHLDRERDRRAGRTDKPVAAGQVPAAWVRRAAVAAAVACVPLSLLSGWRAGAVHLAAVAVAWGYNLGLKATVASALPYAVAFGAVPAFVTLGLPGHPAPPAWAVAAGALMGMGAHFLNALPDLDDDARTGVRGLPHRLGPRRSLVAGVVLLGAATALVALAPGTHLGWAGTTLTVATLATLAAVVLAVAAGRSRAAWSGSIGVALLSVAALVARGPALVP